MTDIRIVEITDGNIEICRELCNELMAFQQSKATLAPEAFDAMNFDTRMKKSYDNALDRQVLVAMDGDAPVGYAFSTIERAESSAVSAYPAWAPSKDPAISKGFYPEWLDTPCTVGILSNLYVREEYRAHRLGSRLFERAMAWLESAPDADPIFIYVSNGNDAALRFYLSRGFTYSHEVFGGFIHAVYKKRS